MPKPKWLIDREMGARRIKKDPDLCGDCLYFGKFAKYSKIRDKGTVEIHECDIHPGCLNAKYSIGCDDFMR